MFLCSKSSSKKIINIVGAHDALSARIGELAGFDAVWASSLGLSTVAGRRDCNELSWTDMVDAAEQMVEAIQIPVILDGNEGFGDATIASLLAKRAARRGIYGLSLEDKVFPKENSFAGPARLIKPEQFAAKLSACRAAVPESNLVLIGRTEGFIAGASLQEVLDRAEAYAEAGASAIIVHSKAPTICEIDRFMKLWSGRCPVVAIPTTYPATPLETFEKLGLAAVIWANQLLRAAIGGMSEAAQLLLIDCGRKQLETELPSLGEVFSLVDRTKAPLPRPQ